MQQVAEALNESGVNEILLSVDCFHEESLPLPWVHSFAEKLVNNYKGKLSLNPAWVVNEAHDNPYNRRTRECLKHFNGIAVNPDGNVVVCSFPIGNIYEKNILDILNEYNPMNNPFTAALMESGISGLIAYAESIGIKINPDEYYSPCGICRSLAQSELYG